MTARRMNRTLTPGATSSVTSSSSIAVTVAYMPAVVRTRWPGTICRCISCTFRCRLRCGRIITK
jgi:hypothetical protein